MLSGIQIGVVRAEFEPSLRKLGCSHACLTRLDLTIIPVHRDCAGIAKRFIINAR